MLYSRFLYCLYLLGEVCGRSWKPFFFCKSTKLALEKKTSHCYSRTLLLNCRSISQKTTCLEASKNAKKCHFDVNFETLFLSAQKRATDNGAKRACEANLFISLSSVIAFLPSLIMDLYFVSFSAMTCWIWVNSWVNFEIWSSLSSISFTNFARS